MIIESPFQNKRNNVAYAKKCLEDSLLRGEAPFASHLLYPGVLDDTVPDQRKRGIEAGHAWTEQADLVAVYVDRGFTYGMILGIIAATKAGVEIVFRQIEEGP